MKTIYSTKVKATGGRNGQVTSDDGILSLETRIPKEMGGAGGSFTNPEQLFAAGYAACFDSALNLVIRKSGLKVENTAVYATVGIGEQDGGYGLSVLLEVEVPGIEKELAEELASQAHQVCPYSNATRGNIPVEVKVIM